MCQLSRLFWVMLFSLLASYSHANSSSLEQIQQSGVIRIAHRDASIPFSYVLAKDQAPVGFAIDICLKIASSIREQLKRPNLKIEWVPVSSPTRIPAIRDNLADMECGSTTNNQERRKSVNFAIPHFFAAGRMIVNKQSGITRWNDLKGKTVATTQGSTNVSYLERVNYSYALNASIVLAKDHREAFSMVENGKVVAFAMDDVLLAGLRASSAKPNDYEIVGEPQSVEPYAIMYRKDDVEFGRLINRTIVAMFQSGEFQTLYKKWFESPIPPNNLNLQLPMNQLMRYNIRWPSDKVD